MAAYLLHEGEIALLQEVERFSCSDEDGGPNPHEGLPLLPLFSAGERVEDEDKEPYAPEDKGSHAQIIGSKYRQWVIFRLSAGKMAVSYNTSLQRN